MNHLKIKPLSTNDAWQGRRFKTNDYKAYEQELLLILPRLNIPQNTPLSLTIETGFSSNSSDLSNIIKQFEDILCKKYGLNDKWNFEIHMYKKLVAKGKDYIAFDLSPINTQN